MKKFVLAMVILATLIVALVSTGEVSVQGTTQPIRGRGARGGIGAI